ncbi:hypothetical protein RMQ97_07610 [Maricaulis sp. D1M11]|uniref:hypothetical protein n=1 Tax=Maricaulis sp. D1M11 TaxID=3076117 RepID=UPI0039B66D30
MNLLRLTAAGLFFGLLAAVAWIAFSQHIDAQVLTLAGEQANVEDRGAAGDFLNVKIGLPIAAIGAVAGVVITLFAGLLAYRQGDVDVMRFVEESITPALNLQSNLARQLSYTLTLSRRCWHCAHSYFDAQNLSERTAQERQEKEDEVARAKASFDGEFAKARTAIQGVLRSLRDADENMYASKLLREQIRGIPASRDMVRYLMDYVPEKSVLRANIYPHDLIYSINNLERFGDESDFDEALRAYAQLPVGDTDIEYLGYLLFRWYLRVDEPIPVKGGQIEVFTLNVGAALLMSLYELLPNKTVALRLFNEIFGGRSDVARRILRVAGPSREQVATQRLQDAMEEQFQNPSHLITVGIRDKNGYLDWKYYDRKVHGAIPPGHMLSE